MRPLLIVCLIAALELTGCDNSTCGNGVLEGDEICEGDCPTTCDDGNPCTHGTLHGNPNECTSYCEWTYTTSCADGDGCCLTSCNAENDDDCSAICGNHVVEAGETCDGSCPEGCDDVDRCTTDELVGTAEDCTAECIHTDITQCQTGDGCCPSGCNRTNDQDCEAECGNGLVEGDETCDGDCPTTCSDSDPCTTEQLTGTPSNCDVVCDIQPITTCASTTDGCCPAGCSANDDGDCSPICGNGVAESGEACDGNDGTLTCTDQGQSQPGVPPCATCQQTDFSVCCGNPSWTTPLTVASPGAVTGLALATDDGSRLHYAHCEGAAGNRSLYYGNYDGASWTTSLVDDGGDRGLQPSIAVDGDGYPHISYHDGSTLDLMRAVWNGSSWSISTLAVGDYSAASKIAFPLGDTHYAVAHSGASGMLTYVVWNDTTSQYDHLPVDIFQILPGDLDMVIDAAGMPHIVFHDEGSGGSVFYATWDTATWTIELVDNNLGLAADRPSISLDGLGRPHVVYHAPAQTELRYAARTGGTWQTQALSISVAATPHPTFVLDSAGREHLLYDGAADDLIYRYWDGTAYQNTTVDTGVSDPTALLLTGSGMPRVVYSNGTSVRHTDLACP